MSARRSLTSGCYSSAVVITMVLLHATTLRAQQPPPWSGIAANEASRTPGWAQGSNDMSSHSLSADGRFVLFHSSISTLVPNDDNGWNDVFLRDRVTGELTRVSVASDGAEGNHYSANPVISADGRFIAFYSCASNFDPTDTNGACDLFVHDRVEHTTMRQSFGPNGEQATGVTSQFRLSGDGRYLVFNASFDSQTWLRQVYLRDRDPDANGVFDEPGLSTTTPISESTVGPYQLGATEDVAISNDARYIAYIAITTDTATSTEIGLRVYVHDRVTAMTNRVDLPGLGIAETFAFASGPDFSDAGHLAYATNAPLVETDTDTQEDVYVINLITGGNVFVEVTQLNPAVLTYVMAPAISADGRYVAVMTSELTPWYSWNYNVYGVDRQTLQSYLVSVFPSGMAEYEASAPSITADGSGIAFAAHAEMLINGWGNRGVFVATDVTITTAETEVPETGGTYTVEVTAPATTGWSLEYGPNATVTPSSGTGSATIEVTIAQNTSPDDVTSAITLGSEQVVFHQTAPPQIHYTMPYYGPTSGGTDVDIFGAGFAEGMTVEFGGALATNVTFIDSGHIVATTPAHFGGWVNVKVTKPSGASAELQDMFYFDDTTPPIVTSQVTGTLGADGWYTSDVSVTWTVEDNESTIGTDPCLPFSQTTDVSLTFATCYAESSGGSTFAEVQIKRDTVPPSVVVAVPQPSNEITYVYGSQVQLVYNCDDATSGIAACTPNQSFAVYLDTTSFVGWRDFVVTATDAAGHSVTSNPVNYSVKYSTTLDALPATGVYGGSTTLEAVLSSHTGGGQPGGTIAFFVDNVPVGTAVTSQYGIAVLTLSLTGLNAGTHALRTEFAGDVSNLPSSSTNSLVINKATPVITWATPSFIVAGTPLGSTQLNATTTVPGTFVYNPTFGTVLAPGNRTLNVSFTPNDAANYNGATKSVALKVKAIPVITWPTPAAITYPAFLGATQLNATANVAGSFVYTPPAGTLLDAGTHTIYVTFTPSDTADYVSESSTTTLQVLKGTVTLNWPNINPLTYGAPLTGLQLNATASASGSFTYSPPYGTILNAGTHTLTVTFTPNSPPNYYPATATREIVVNKAYPVVYWQGDLAPIVYGTPLGAAQLYATSPNAGTITYNPPAGTVLDAGLRIITMTFTPDDTANYHTVTYQKQIAVDKQTTTVTWNNPAQIVYGTALTAAQLNATASQPGTFSYNPPAGTVLNAGMHSLSVYFTPDSPNYYGGTWYVTLVVAKRTPVITWSNPAPIVYGTALSNAQLNASANTSGTFTYTPAAGTVLGAGTRTLSVTFEPSDPANNNAASASTTIVVSTATPVITWPDQGHITYGTPLSASQLNATANVAGTFIYTPDFGAELPAGNYTLSVTFTPTDAANYSAASDTALLAVFKQAPVVTWPTPAAITYGTPLSAAQLNATANVPGTFVYIPAAGAVIGAGTPTLYVNFTPDDTDNYQTPASVGVTLQVDQATPVITWATPPAITFGAALSAAQLNATANVPGTFAYSPATGTVLPAGTQTLAVTFTPSDTVDYTTAVANVALAVNQATPVITWATPSAITYGTALSATQLNATADVSGTFVYSPAAGTVLGAGTQPLSVSFTPTDAVNYTTATAGVSIVVGKTAPVVSWTNPAGITYGAALSSTQLNATANVPGTFAYTPAAGTVLNAGTQPLSVTFTPNDAANYTTASAGVSIVVAKATPMITWANPAGINYGTALSATQLNATANVAGTFAYSPAAGTVLGAGTSMLAVTFTATDAGNYNSESANRSITVAAVPLTIGTDNASKVYGQALPAFTASGTGLVNGDTLASLTGTLSYATAATATSAPGAYQVTPSGVSSPNYTITFAAGTLTVTQASTAVALTTTPSPSNHNQTVQLRAVVTAVAPGAGTPTGTVQFRDNGVLLGTANVVNGVATLNKNFKRGTHPLTAVYSGSVDFTTSTGSKTHQTN